MGSMDLSKWLILKLCWDNILSAKKARALHQYFKARDVNVELLSSPDFFHVLFNCKACHQKWNSFNSDFCKGGQMHLSKWLFLILCWDNTLSAKKARAKNQYFKAQNVNVELLSSPDFFHVLFDWKACHQKWNSFYSDFPEWGQCIWAND